VGESPHNQAVFSPNRCDLVSPRPARPFSERGARLAARLPRREPASQAAGREAPLATQLPSMGRAASRPACLPVLHPSQLPSREGQAGRRGASLRRKWHNAPRNRPFFSQIAAISPRLDQLAAAMRYLQPTLEPRLPANVSSQGAERGPRRERGSLPPRTSGRVPDRPPKHRRTAEEPLCGPPANARAKQVQPRPPAKLRAAARRVPA
jgi:hypothetical protein